MRGGNIGKTAVATEQRLAKTLRDSEAIEAIAVVPIHRDGAGRTGGTLSTGIGMGKPFFNGAGWSVVTLQRVSHSAASLPSIALHWG